MKKLLKKKIVKANANEVKKKTGYSIGGVPPICHNIPTKEIFIDENLSSFQKIYAAAGHPFIVFATNFNQICKITNGKVSDIVD